MFYYYLKYILLLFIAIKIECSASTTNETLNSNNQAYIDADDVINATIGKSAVLKCIVHNVKNYKITWYHSGSLLALDRQRIKNDERYSVENQELNEWKFIINDVDLKDEGLYSCRLDNGLKRIFYLRVGVPPKFTSTDSSHQVLININEFSNLTLSCEAIGNPTPTIHWYKNNKHISDSVSLQLTNITRYNYYEYECVARNSIPPDSSRHFKVNVNFKPTINLMYHIQTHKMPSILEQNANVGDNQDSSNNQLNLEFVCEIYGNPIKSLMWRKDGVKLKETKNIDKQNADATAAAAAATGHHKKSKITTLRTAKLHQHKLLSRLQIKNVNENDNGVYECVVESLDGEVTKTVSVNDIQTKTNTNKLTELIFNGNNKETDRTLSNNNNNNYDYAANNIIEFDIDNKHTTQAAHNLLSFTDKLIEKNSFSHHKDIILNETSSFKNQNDHFMSILSASSSVRSSMFYIFVFLCFVILYNTNT